MASAFGGCVGARTFALDRFHGDGGAGDGDHEHIPLAEHLVIHIDAHDGVGAQRRGALLQLVEGLGARHHQLLLVTCRSAADEVANAGAEILQEVDAGDDLAEDDAVVAAGDAVALYRGSGRDDRGEAPFWVVGGASIPLSAS